MRASAIRTPRPAALCNAVSAVLFAATLAVLLAGSCNRREAEVERGAAPAAPPRAVPAAAGQQVVPAYHAIVIGISKYAASGGSGWEPLVTARKDAEAVADTLEQKYDFKVTRLLDGDATRSAIVGALADMASLSSNDAVLIYFAGHGFFDETLGEGYWIPADARRAEVSGTANADWVWNSVVTKMVAATRAHR